MAFEIRCVPTCLHKALVTDAFVVQEAYDYYNLRAANRGSLVDPTSLPFYHPRANTRIVQHKRRAPGIVPLYKRVLESGREQEATTNM